MTTLDLNSAQRQAVEYRRGPLLVLAGAGSGKTRVLTARLAHLVAHGQVRPHRILAVTFTNRAAGEMRRRVGELLGREPAGLWIGTFHALAARLLRREAHLLGFTSQFTIYDEDDRLALVKRLLERLGHSPKTFPPRLITSLISAAKNRLVSPEELAATADDAPARVAAAVYANLGDALQTANAMDFDDLLLHPLALFAEHPDRLAYYQDRFVSILVDEFQDTNRAQYLLVKQLGARHRDICAVGDDDQSIYAWRGADLRNILDFQSDFPEAALIRLEQNYRSTQRILDAANGVIADNRARLGKTLFTVRQGGEPIALVASADERDEAEWVARELRSRSAEEHYAFSDMAVLYRTNAQSRAFEEAFRRAAIPHRVVGAVSFYERREVKDLVAYLRLIVNPADDEAFLRAVQAPRRGIGLGSLATLHVTAAQWRRPLLDTAAIADRIGDLRPLAKQAFQQFAKLIQDFRAALPGLAPAALLERLIETLNYEAYLAEEGPEGMERIENVRELMAGAAEWSEEADLEPEDTASAVERFLTTAALATSEDKVGGDPEGVTLLTVHSAKGLEWPIVVLAGLEDGLFPLSRALETPEGTEEERRLAYVGITRARDRLYVTWARARRRGGQLMPGRPSRFLDALPPEVIEERRTSGVFGGELFRRKPGTAWRAGSLTAPKPEVESQDAPRYVKGERVRHRKFGAGIIRGLAGVGRDLKVVVEFDDQAVGTKQLLVAYAGLERDWEPA
ncbi:MAG: UvrD-helicase domain-containing protein [Gemmatimonadetes bacterium]|nr:UvrD-helicase domain-containing protein [Gemmatimonadota bacterium]